MGLHHRRLLTFQIFRYQRHSTKWLLVSFPLGPLRNYTVLVRTVHVRYYIVLKNEEPSDHQGWHRFQPPVHGAGTPVALLHLRWTYSGASCRRDGAQGSLEEEHRAALSNVGTVPNPWVSVFGRGKRVLAWCDGRRIPLQRAWDLSPGVQH